MKWGYAVLVGVLLFSIIVMAVGILSGDSINANVAVIPIYGVITIDGSAGLGSSGASSTDIVEFIERADKAPMVQAIVLEINSPGGSAVASDEIARAVERVDKPVIAWIREAGASGAYWVASEADYVVANRMSITGSVGVLASYFDISDFLTEHNVTYQRITGGEYKDTGSMFSGLSDDERSLLQAKVDMVHAFFLEDVQENRNLSDETVEVVRTGIFFLGVEAQELGLVDALGGEHEVEEWLSARVDGVPTYRRFERQKTFFEELASVSWPGVPAGVRIQS